GYVSVELADFLFHIEKVVNLTPEGAISYSSLIVLSQYGYDQYIPGLNRVEAMVQDLGFWKKLKETENEPTMKLLEVAQAHYQKFIKLMRRKKKNEE
ncbi:hypothetical protein Goari_025176, partial [Gossypium aridum]|nr:hypothetical protein [Gossypium aridum]